MRVFVTVDFYLIAILEGYAYRGDGGHGDGDARELGEERK